MKNQQFNPKNFLKVTTLSPIEELGVKGGVAKEKKKVKEKLK